jgi:hypothetical protein
MRGFRGEGGKKTRRPKKPKTQKEASFNKHTQRSSQHFLNSIEAKPIPNVGNNQQKRES